FVSTALVIGLSGVSSWQRLHPHGGRGEGGLPYRPSPSPPTGTLTRPPGVGSSDAPPGKKNVSDLDIFSCAPRPSDRGLVFRARLRICSLALSASIQASRQCPSLRARAAA